MVSEYGINPYLNHYNYFVLLFRQFQCLFHQIKYHQLINDFNGEYLSDSNKDGSITIKEWGKCLGLKEGWKNERKLG
jgi:hypothetical protein